MLCLVTQSCLALCDPVDCSQPGTSVHGDSLGKNTGVGCYALLQGISPAQGSNPGLPHCRWILFHLSHQGSPRILERVAYPFSREFSWPRIKPGSPALQADSLPAELPGKPLPWALGQLNFENHQKTKHKLSRKHCINLERKNFHFIAPHILGEHFPVKAKWEEAPGKRSISLGRMGARSLAYEQELLKNRKALFFPQGSNTYIRQIDFKTKTNKGQRRTLHSDESINPRRR